MERIEKINDSLERVTNYTEAYYFIDYFFCNVLRLRRAVHFGPYSDPRKPSYIYFSGTEGTSPRYISEVEFNRRLQEYKN